MSDRKTAIIIGAGPAGLTAAYELLARTDIVPVVLEASDSIGGISQTVNYKGNRMDIGGHRFFSKSDRVMQWWMQQMPVEKTASGEADIFYHGQQTHISTGSANPDTEDRVMLVRKRVSRIYFLRKFFRYPISLSPETMRNLGLWRMLRIGSSYLRYRLFPVKPEVSLEDFFINRFGKELYLTFFKDYTEKVWGFHCNQISKEWGAQRIKGLSISKAIAHALKPPRRDISQKGTETSLIERFLYPKFGPGQLWEHVADEIRRRGGSILMKHTVCGLGRLEPDFLNTVYALNADGEECAFEADYVFSTMPVKDLVEGMRFEVPAEVRETSSALPYRDFITVGLLLKKLKTGAIPDNWVYIQERDVRLGRLQVFNNWSPWLVKDPETVWLGLEYFCQEGDELWNMDDASMKEFAATELEQIGIIDRKDVLDGTVVRMKKTYPAYTGAYARFETVRTYLDSFQNLYPIGRNGMHKYNNSDHSMLTAMCAVDNIIAGIKDKSGLWAINTEMEYHETK
ncbi:MAG: NAD(P)/FAD-dependent oxidoreductase [Bacteroidetes bacterium]|nr:NAD(P)/FAD-dependent oxidoreductase [Bacteroidota bacterium]